MAASVSEWKKPHSLTLAATISCKPQRFRLAVASLYLLAMLYTIDGVSGYFGSLTDLLIQRLIEIVNAFPQVPRWLAFGAVLPMDWPPLSTYFAITIVLSLLGWTGLARVVRMA